MAYRRRHGVSKSSTFREEIYNKLDSDDDNSNNNKNKLTPSYSFTPGTMSSSSLAAQAIKASAARRDSPLSSGYTADSVPQGSKVFGAYEETSGGKDARGFWDVLARKAKSILDDDKMSQQAEMPARSSRFQMADASTGDQLEQQSLGPDRFKKIDNPAFRKGLDKITTSLNQIGDTFEKAYEEGRTIVENRTADIKQQIRRKGSSPEGQNQELSANTAWQQTAQPQSPMNHENQLKASRDVTTATAAKAKLLLRELKTIKADLAFAKQRCTQLEDENKLLRESREKGENAADDDLIRLQLETLLAEKARLARENSVYARENRFLREVVEYHQLTMQDVVFLDEGSEELAEVDDPYARTRSGSPHSPVSPPSPSEINASESPPLTTLGSPVPHAPEQTQREASLNDAQSCPNVPAPDEKKAKSIPISKEEEKAKVSS